MPRPRQAERAGGEADAFLLTSRLRQLGLPSATSVRVHTNRSVMVSTNGRHNLGVHRGYAYAPDHVLQAVVTFVAPRTRRSERDAARRTVVAFPVERYVVSQGRRRAPVSAEAVGADVARLREAYTELNRIHFGGTLSRIPLRVSARMTTCLGALSVRRSTGVAREIVVSRRHLERDPWPVVRDTLLHEMVHQWQVQQGYPADHGRHFKAKARAVGIVPAARSMTTTAPREAPSLGRT